MKLWELISPNLLIESTKKTEDAGVFLPLPKEINKCYPKKNEDKSKQHITILYFGSVLKKDKILYKKAVQDAINDVEEIGICEIKKKKSMENKEGQIIIYNPIECKKLEKLREKIIKNCKEKNLEIQDEYIDEYKMHTTIAYLDKEGECNEEGYIGEFKPTYVEIWGFDNNIKMELK